MPKKISSYAVSRAKAPFVPFSIERRDPRPHDVSIQILWAGICHSDVHQVRAEWDGTHFPMVPGHEIIGKVDAVGAAVHNFRVGDVVGVGCMVDACRRCEACHEHQEQFCLGGASMTYNSLEQDKKTPTYGGYSTHIVVTEDFVLRIPTSLDLAAATPLLCAGITTYSPLKRHNAGPGKRVAVLGLGGLGHMAVKIAKAMGAQVTVITRSESKRSDAMAMGANRVVVTSAPETLAETESGFHIIINTIAGKHDLRAYLRLLRFNGVMVMLGLPEAPLDVGPGDVVGRGLSFSGSLIGGIRQTQEMLDFCAEHNVVCDVEKITARDIDKAYDRVVDGQVKYRFVIDASTFADASKPHRD